MATDSGDGSLKLGEYLFKVAAAILDKLFELEIPHLFSDVFSSITG